MSLENVYDDFYKQPIEELHRKVSTGVYGPDKMEIAKAVHDIRRDLDANEQTKRVADAAEATATATRYLMIATWGLVLVTLILVVVTFFA